MAGMRGEHMANQNAALAADKKEQVFFELLKELTTKNVTSEETFRVIYNDAGSDELLRTRHFQQLRDRAFELGVTKIAFSALSKGPSQERKRKPPPNTRSRIGRLFLGPSGLQRTAP